MELLIHFLLISCLSIIIAETARFPSAISIEKIIEEGQSITGSPNTNLKLLESGQIFRNEFTLVWKGIYNDTTPVAIKICHNEETVEEEMDIFRELDAEDVDIEKYRVPRVYYHGPILGEYFAIAMTLFDGNLENRFVCHNRKFSDSTTLLIFKQIMEGYKYIHRRNMVHNPNLLRNTFTRGQDIFLGDFTLSPLDDNVMDDYKALLISVWRMVGMPPSEIDEPIAVKLAYFKNRIVRKAFQSILKIEGIHKENCSLPNYEEIINTADAALIEISTKLRPVQFDWLTEGPSGESSRNALT